MYIHHKGASMKLVNSTIILGALVLTGCGKNAHVNKILTQSSEAIKTVVEDPNIEQIELSILATDLTLGNIEKSKEKLVPIVITNNGKDSIDKIVLTSNDSNIVVDEPKELVLNPGKSTIVYVKVTEDAIGEFQKDINVQYSKLETQDSKTISLSGNVTESAALVSSDLGITRQEDESLDFETLPVDSTHSKEVILKNVGPTSSIVTSVELINGEDFELSDSSNSCIGSVVEDCSVVTSFVPTKAGTFTDTVVVTFVDANGVEGKKRIAVTGDSVAESKCIEINEVATLSKKLSDLKEDERRIELPYYETMSGSNIRIDALINEESNRVSTRLEETVHYVNDGQVVTIFDVDSKRTNGNVDLVELHVDMKKFTETPGSANEKTEILCIEDVMTCSGVRFTARSFAKHINPNYVLDGDKFSQDILMAGEASVEAGKKFLNLKKTYDLFDMFTQTSESLKKELELIPSTKIILSDDIKLEDRPQLNIKYTNIKDELNKCIK